MFPSPDLDDWIVAEYANGVDPAEIGRRVGLAEEQVLAVVSRTTTGSSPSSDPAEQVIAAYAENQHPDLIAVQTGLTTDQVYDIVHRSAGIPKPYRMESWVVALIIGAAVLAVLVLAGGLWMMIEAGRIL
jgi:hypothetical protein